MAETRGLRAAWTVIGGVLFHFTLNALARAWQWPLALPGVGLDEATDPYAAALIAVPSCLVLVTILAVYGAENAVRIKQGGVLDLLEFPNPSV